MLPVDYRWCTSDSSAWDRYLGTFSRANKAVCDYRVKIPLTGSKPLPKRILLIIHCKPCILEGLNFSSFSRNTWYLTPGASAWKFLFFLTVTLIIPLVKLWVLTALETHCLVLSPFMSSSSSFLDYMLLETKEPPRSRLDVCCSTQRSPLV